MRQFTITTDSGIYIRISKRAARTMFGIGAPIVVCNNKYRPGYPFAMHSDINSKRWIEDCQSRYKDTSTDIVETAWRNMLAEWSYANLYSDHEYPMFYLYSPNPASK